MKKNEFIKKTILGGLVIVLPVAILAMGVNWLFNTVTDLIQPLTSLVVDTIGFPELIGDIIVLVAMIASCFIMGWLVSTQLGSLFHQHFDKRLSRLAPGYKLVKDIVGQFLGDSTQSPFTNGEVALVQLFGNSTTLVTAIVTSKHENGNYTIFMPTGPNPTSGNIYHVQASQVTLCPNIKIEEAMRTIIACGAGSGDLFKEYH